VTKPRLSESKENLFVFPSDSGLVKQSPKISSFCYDNSLQYNIAGYYVILAPYNIAIIKKYHYLRIVKKE
jgi:hypothetical protein